MQLGEEGSFRLVSSEAFGIVLFKKASDGLGNTYWAKAHPEELEANELFRGFLWELKEFYVGVAASHPLNFDELSPQSEQTENIRAIVDAITNDSVD